ERVRVQLAELSLMVGEIWESGPELLRLRGIGLDLADRRSERDRTERDLPGVLESDVEGKLASSDDPELRVFPEMLGRRRITGDDAFTDGQPPDPVPTDDGDEIRGASCAGGCSVPVEQVQVA